MVIYCSDLITCIQSIEVYFQDVFFSIVLLGAISLFPQLGSAYRGSYCIPKRWVSCPGLHEALVPRAALPGLVPWVSKAWFLGCPKSLKMQQLALAFLVVILFALALLSCQNICLSIA